jgi:PAS domain S-box-containing protein
MACILIVDGRPARRTALAALLAGNGHRPLEAADGAEALEHARAGRPDLIIAEILMPAMDGYELVRRLRADPATAATPVILRAARCLEREARGLADACGVRQILLEPSEPEVVLSAVDGALRPPETPPAHPPPEDGVDREDLRLLAERLARTADDLRLANLRLGALLEACSELALDLDPARILQACCEGARGVIGARAAALAVASEAGGALEHVVTTGGAGEPSGSNGIAPGAFGALAEIAASGRPVRIVRHDAGPDARRLLAGFPGAASLLGVPFRSPARVHGWLCLADKLGAEAFTEEDEGLAGTLASQAAIAFENALRHEETAARASELEREMQRRARAEEALRLAERKYREIFEGALDGIFRATPEGRFLVANPALARILGYDTPDALVAAVHDGERQLYLDPRERQDLLRRLEEKGSASGVEVRWRRRDGSSIWISLTARKVVEPGEAPFVEGIVKDVTDKKLLEEKFLQVQRLEAVGRLAGGVAHDFNNLLTVIQGCVDLSLREARADDPNRQRIQEIERAAGRAAGLTQQLLAFSRRQVQEPLVLDLNLAVSEMEKMLRRLIGEDVALRFTPGERLWRVRADPGQIGQILLNLAVNARDAMPEGGTLTVETHNVELDETYALRHVVVAPGRYVMLAVSDTGVGMDAATLEHAFEPFFTTKERGKGTGLGLSTVYGIVKQSGGYIWAYSEPGRGTTFKIYLPRCDAGPDRRAGAGQAAPSIPKGTETILVVEDEDMVRDVIRMVLESCGYRVILTGGGREGLDAVRGFDGPIHLLLTDVVMPGLSGREVAREACRVRPDMRVLYISGYTDDAIVSRGILMPGVEFLHKPFTRQSLARKVREILDGGH